MANFSRGRGVKWELLHSYERKQTRAHLQSSLCEPHEPFCPRQPQLSPSCRLTSSRKQDRHIVHYSGLRPRLLLVCLLPLMGTSPLIIPRFTRHSCSSPLPIGDKPSQTQFRGIIRDTFASPTLSSPLAKNTPPPPKPSQKPKTACESYASSLEDRSSSSLAEKEAEQMSEAEYQERLKHWREVAAILRQNVVQGRKVEKEARDAQVSEKAEGLTGEDGNVWSTCSIPTLGWTASFSSDVTSTLTDLAILPDPCRTAYHPRHRAGRQPYHPSSAKIADNTVPEPRAKQTQTATATGAVDVDIDSVIPVVTPIA